MTSLSNQELQSVISELDMAYSWHDQWYKNLLRTLIVGIPSKTTDLMPDAHLQCPFGQWYQKARVAAAHDESHLSRLGTKHEKMHRRASVLLQKRAEDLPIPLHDWEQFQSALDGMRSVLQSLQHELVKQVQAQDPLTGAQNRAVMQSDLREQHALVQREVTTCALAMLDLDHFKAVNDNFGHSAGDAVLISIVECVKGVIRPYDQIYRYGGEEFVICMPGVNITQAQQLAERIREAIAALDIRLEDAGESIQVTTSIGVSMHSQSRSIEESVRLADEAMYQAKASGRNRVVAV